VDSERQNNTAATSHTLGVTLTEHATVLARAKAALAKIEAGTRPT
jgi:hypothetical protein